MPTYEYRCTDCGRDLEVVQKFSDASLTECPTCSGKLRKVFNAVGVVFKGSGFYRNDSRAPSNGASAAADGGGAEKKSDATEKAGDSKPATADAAKKETKTESTKPDKVGANGSPSSSSTGSKAAAN